MRIIVVGVGNLIRSDDGLGVHAVRRLAGDPRLPRDSGVEITFIDGGTRGMDLVNEAGDASHVLILDAIDIDARPGTPVSISGRELQSLPTGRSVHQLGIVDWIRGLAMVAGRVPEIQVLGLQPADTSWGMTLSPEVRSGLDGLVDAAIDRLRQWISGALA
jgi:hydrogenase maturation protease